MEAEEPLLPSTFLLKAKEHPTDWKAISLATTLSCLVGIEGLLVGISRWPYLVQSDPEVTSQYYGFAISISKCFHAIFAFVFAYVTYKTREIRWALLTGRILALTAGVLYLTVELLPMKREVLVVTYVLHEVSSASMAVLRAWVAACSSTVDRTRAFASLILAFWSAAMIAPLFQLLFTSLPAPGRELPFGLHLNLYTAPMFMALVINILCLPFILMITKESRENLMPPKPFVSSYMSVKRRIDAVMELDLNWHLVILCWVQKMIVMFPFITLLGLYSPILMITQGWNGPTTVAVQSLNTAGTGGISILVITFFLGCRHSKRISPRLLYGAGLFIFLMAYFFSYPFEKLSNTIPAYNETDGSGCNPEEYSWCSSGRAVSSAAFIASTITQNGLGLPIAQIALDGVYSRLIGHLDQNILQSVVVVAEDMVFIFGPSVTTWMFAAYGQAFLWIVNGSIVFAGLMLWLCFSHRIKMG